MKKLVIFDMDGTLLDTLPYTIDVMNAALMGLGYRPLEDDTYNRLLGAKLKVMSESLLKIVHPGYEQEEVKRLMEKIVTNVPHREKYRPIVMFKTMGQVLLKLKEMNITMAVYSNTPHEITRLFCRENLPDCFQVIYGDGAIVSKPSPEGIYQIIEECGADRAQTVLVGDTLTDFETSVNAGIGMAGVTWGCLSKAELKSLDILGAADNGCHLLEILINFFG